MPFAYFKDNKYFIANAAQEAFEGHGSTCSELSPDMPDLKLITFFNASTGEVKFTQITEPN